MGYYNGGWSAILIAISEVIVFAWIYGRLRYFHFIDIFDAITPSLGASKLRVTSYKCWGG